MKNQQDKLLISMYFSGLATTVLHPISGRVRPPSIIIDLHEPPQAAGVQQRGGAGREAALRHTSGRRLRT